MNNSKSNAQQQQHPVDVSPIDAQDRHDILTQQVIDDLARRSRGRRHEDVVTELAERVAEQNLPPKPQPWLEAVAASAISGNAYVVTATTALVCDVPQPSTDRSGKTVK